MTSALQQNQIWAINGPMLFLFATAAAILLAVHAVNQHVSEGLADKFRAKTAQAAALVVLLTLLSNLLGVATISLHAKLAVLPPRPTLVVLPLLLVAGRCLLPLLRRGSGRAAALSGLVGSVAGMLAGAWLFLRGPAAESLVKATLPSNVKTAPVDRVIGNPERWAVSVQLLVLYGVSLAIFFGVHACLRLAARPLEKNLRGKRGRELAISVLSAVALNFLAVAALVHASRTVGMEPRLAMIAVPLFLVIESYVRLLRGEPENRRSHWAGLLGSSAGTIAAVLLLMRDAPLH